MTEPTYTYVRGQGWVLTPPADTIVLERNGKRVTAMRRRPEYGEYYFYNSNNHRSEWERRWRDEQGNFLFAKFVEFFVERDTRDRDFVGCHYQGQSIPDSFECVVFEVTTL